MTRPAAPYPANTRAKGWRFELDYEQVEQSSTWQVAKSDGKPWLLMLWLMAWKQVPCGTWPTDEDVIAGAIGIDEEGWKRHRKALLRGWVEHDDGRLYHPTITARVLEMMTRRRSDADRKSVGRKSAKGVFERDGACVYCASTEKLTVDHILPKSQGGDSDERNLAAACHACNSRKTGRTPEQAGMPIINPAAADRWRQYRESFEMSAGLRAESAGQKPMSAGLRAESSTDHRPPNTKVLEPDGSNPPPTPPTGGVGVRAVSPIAAVTLALRAAGMPTATINTAHPTFVALVSGGVTAAEFVALVPKSMEASDPFAYLLGAVVGQRKRAGRAAQDIAGTSPPAAPAPPPEPAWRQEQRQRTAAFAGRAAAKPAGTPPADITEISSGNVTPLSIGR